MYNSIWLADYPWHKVLIPNNRTDNKIRSLDVFENPFYREKNRSYVQLAVPTVGKQQKKIPSKWTWLTREWRRCEVVQIRHLQKYIIILCTSDTFYWIPTWLLADYTTDRRNQSKSRSLLLPSDQGRTVLVTYFSKSRCVDNYIKQKKKILTFLQSICKTLVE